MANVGEAEHLKGVWTHPRNNLNFLNGPLGVPFCKLISNFQFDLFEFLS